ncbi:MAG: cytochrome c [Burkholderiaceae bacterium]
MKRILWALLALAILVPTIAIGLQYWHEPDAGETAPAAAADPAQLVARGAYLARAGDCMACHTARGGADYAGGRLIATPFGDIYSPNITPDAATGIGGWSADDFWRALHNGKSKNGDFLYPAFPYPNYTRITRADSDAMYAYFRTLPAVNQPNRPHALRFPYNQRPLLAAWRALYFRPGVQQPDTGQSLEWNRGAYLVQGLGHCNACHADRNVLGATQNSLDLAGGLIPILNWYAPPLGGGAAALGGWSEQDLADFLKIGISARGAAYGPMAEVVRVSLQHLTDADIGAMAVYLKSLPGGAPVAVAEPPDAAQQAQLKLGEKLYGDHCIDCHKADGAGVPPHYPALAGNRALALASPINTIRMVLNGGFPPSTGGNPRPYGMPPFGPALDDAEVAALVSYVRRTWGNAPPVTAADVRRYRAVPVE